MAAAAWSWVEKMLQEAQRTSAPSHREGLDEHGGLHGHVQDPVIEHRSNGFLPVLVTHRHQAGHLVLGQTDLVPTGWGQGEIGNFEVHCTSLAGLRLSGHNRRWHLPVASRWPMG